uniref:Uncharacterized protein n=1 Tax=Physcomitrium patens TaxID=3218 RepID=A0A2K1JID7_PHYPA|nr:hypothetical protein PHYPA_018678 [Physcomitrium patens]PNR41279.1 hypothetical protein PHYPA_018682 [Physcomitrium patens]
MQRRGPMSTVPHPVLCSNCCRSDLPNLPIHSSRRSVPGVKTSYRSFLFEQAAATSSIAPVYQPSNKFLPLDKSSTTKSQSPSLP